MNTIRVDIDSILSTISKNPSISDLHLNCDEKSSYRINGEIFKGPKYSNAKQWIYGDYSKTTPPKQRSKFW